jgi:hypothetical protein
LDLAKAWKPLDLAGLKSLPAQSMASAGAQVRDFPNAGLSFVSPDFVLAAFTQLPETEGVTRVPDKLHWHLAKYEQCINTYLYVRATIISLYGF